MVSKTAEELQKELATIDFSAIAGGGKLIVWVQEIESDAGIVELPMLKISVPMATKERAGPLAGQLLFDQFTDWSITCNSLVNYVQLTGQLRVTHWSTTLI